jgi:two-component system, OmpR family, response regulator
MDSPTLLCIDDRSEFLELRKTALEPLGYSVATASDIASAIAILREAAIAAVIVDYKFEGMDAEAAAFLIKQQFPEQPIILMSAYHDLPERVLWLVDDYVMRSESVEGLGRVIERVTRPASTPDAQKFAAAADRPLKRRPAAA